MSEEEKEIKHWTIILLDRPRLDFLDQIGKDAIFSTGHRLSYNVILRALVDAAMDLGLSGEGVGSFEAFKKVVRDKLMIAHSQKTGLVPKHSAD
jgi:hypothetical protein